MSARIAGVLVLFGLLAQGCSKPSSTACEGNLQTDPGNCGACGNVCPTPLNAAAACMAGVCGRAVCASGWYDFDGAAIFGCEVSCGGATCTLPSGAVRTLAVPPIHETQLSFGVVASGGAFGDRAQASATHRNTGILGVPAEAGSSTVYTAEDRFTAGQR